MNALYMTEVILGILVYAYSTFWFIGAITKEIYTKEQYASKVDKNTNTNIIIGSVVITIFLIAFPLFGTVSVINFIVKMFI